MFLSAPYADLPWNEGVSAEVFDKQDIRIFVIKTRLHSKSVTKSVTKKKGHVHFERNPLIFNVGPAGHDPATP